MNNRKTVTIMMAVGLLLMSYGSFSQTAEDLLPKALQLEEVKGELEKAIEMYETIVKNFSENRAIAAKAQFHIGLCYEKLGRSEAMKAYRVVLGKFADQRKLAARAQEKLNALNSTRHNVKPKGMITREVWSDAEDVYDVSPDGRYLSYIDWGTISINVYDIKTGKNWQVTENGTWKEKYKFPDPPMFSPDGKQIAYIWYDWDSVELRIVNLDGSGTRVVSDIKNGTDFHWPVEWSPDGNYFIAIHEIKIMDKTNRKAHKDIIVIKSVKDGSIETLKSLGDQHTQNLSFSSDGQSIVYDLDQESGDKRKDIYYMSTDGSKETVIVEHPANDWYPFWSKDGNHVIFLSDRTGSNGLWSQRVINGLPSGDPIQLKGNLEDRFTPIGRTEKGSLYYSTGSNSQNIFTEGVDLKTGKQTSPSKKLSNRFEGGNRYPIYSPDGKYLAYCSFRTEGNMIKRIFVIHNIETGLENDISTELYLRPNNQWYVPRWTPDSQYLLLHASKNGKGGNREVYTVDIKSGAHKLILGGENLNFRADFPQMDPEGKNIFYLKGQRSFNKYNLKNQQHIEIFSSDIQIYFTELSPDGKYLAFRYWFDNPNDLWIISTNGGKPKKVGSIPIDDLIDWPVWTPDGKSVLVTARKSRKVYLFPIDGSKPTILELTMKDKTQLRIHPDGTRFVYDKTLKGGFQIWSLDNFQPK